MDINIIEENIQKVANTVYFSIIEFIVDAVRTYPLYGLDDVNIYVEEVKKLLKTDTIYLNDVIDYLENNPLILDDDINVWTRDSLGGFYEALILMDMNNISLEEILAKISSLNE